MRIGLVIEEFDPRRGGVEQWTAQAVEELLARGHEVHVVARHFSDETRAMPIVVHASGDVRGRIAFAKAAAETLRTLDLDVTHDTGCGWYCDVFQPHGGSRVAANEQNLLLLPRWLRWLKRSVSGILPRYRQFNTLLTRQYADDGRLVLALSRRVSEDLRRLHQVSAERIRLIYNGVNNERFSPDHRRLYRDAFRRRLGVAEQSVLLLVVAHNFRLKGVPMLLEAMARWPHETKAELVIVGGKHLERFKWRARRLGVEDRTHFVGAVEDTVPYYAAADIYVHPTFYDPCSLVVLEALASGLPVVTSRQNGASELLVDDREGVLLDDPADVTGFLRQIESLLDPGQRDRMGRAARELVQEHTFARNVDELVAIYDEVRESRRRAEDEKMTRFTEPFVCRIRGASDEASAKRTPSSPTGALS